MQRRLTIFVSGVPKEPAFLCIVFLEYLRKKVSRQDEEKQQPCMRIWYAQECPLSLNTPSPTQKPENWEGHEVDANTQTKFTWAAALLFGGLAGPIALTSAWSVLSTLPLRWILFCPRPAFPYAHPLFE